ncbi:hypothetical protein [Parageobacillus thermoglucosidasius]|uniref:hypothetical protein n=1 Tax=Parageobacillus thermoglucosidasius TaxID=1426 RepID=UPI0001D18E47|nr:hypothetical protein [Parageobacillus thermoglucosidasius]AEH46799.1 hypothetical protein Geoth_0801 [Parageobacillus thermoglucosidasius C56-YS93]
MKIVKVSNLIQPNGTTDYKGLDLEKIVPGSQLYPDDNTAYFFYTGNVVEHVDVTVITEEEYNAKKKEIKSKAPLSYDERLELIQKAIDDLVLGGM